MVDITACLEAGMLRPHIVSRFPLNEVAAAHELLEGDHPPGHVVIEIEQE